MATRGTKPRPHHLRLASDNKGKPFPAPTVDPAQQVPPDFDNGLKPPRKLAKRQQELWNQFIRSAPWLTKFDIPLCFMWVVLQAKFEKKPDDTAKYAITQLRTLTTELGFEPSARTRMAIKADDSKSKASKYFDDTK